MILSQTASVLAGLGRFWRFVGNVFARPWRMSSQGTAAAARQRIYAQMYDIGLQSVPVVMITGMFIGMTLAVQSYVQFKGIGLEDRLGSVINISVLRELGPVLAAVMLAGRVGGAMTAELGTMKVTEQIDAYRVMGTDPIRFLVVPRLLACLLLTPLLIAYTDVMGVFGGYIVSVWQFGINSEAYWTFSACVERWDLFAGMAKGIFFGAAMTLIACYKGFTCSRGASGVGRACTEGFVLSFLVILCINYVLSVGFKTVYEAIWGVTIVF